MYSPPGSRLWHTVNERLVRILLECILVFRQMLSLTWCTKIALCSNFWMRSPLQQRHFFKSINHSSGGPRVSQRGANAYWRWHLPIIQLNFPKNCMKTKKIWPGLGCSKFVYVDPPLHCHHDLWARAFPTLITRYNFYQIGSCTQICKCSNKCLGKYITGEVLY